MKIAELVLLKYGRKLTKTKSKMQIPNNKSDKITSRNVQCLELSWEE